jgi:hypothetical protein
MTRERPGVTILASSTPAPRDLVTRREEHRIALGRLVARPDDPAGLAEYATANSNLPGPRGNLELAAAFADVMSCDADSSAWHRVMAEWAAIPADVAPTNDPREFLPFCALLALGSMHFAADRRIRSETEGLLRAAAGSPRWRTREAAAMGMQRIGEANRSALRRIVTEWMDGADLMEQRAIVAALAHPPILDDRSTVLLALQLSRTLVGRVRSMSPESRRTEDFRVLSKGLEYAISVFVAAAPAEGFALLRELSSIDDRDVRRILRSNLGKSRLAARHAADVAEVIRLIDG